MLGLWSTKQLRKLRVPRL